MEELSPGGVPPRADVVVIGGGVVGSAIARELSRYRLSVVLIEKAPDVATGTSKANSGILHAGFDAEPGTWKARLNVRGARLYSDIAEGLGIPRREIGSLVVACTRTEREELDKLLVRGRQNGVVGLEIWDRDRVLDHEQHVSRDIEGALWAPNAAVACPFLATVAFAENAIRNGARLVTECPVTGFDSEGGRLVAVRTSRGRIETRFAVNAAGLYSAAVARLAGDDSFKISPRVGEYVVFDRSITDLARSVLFPTPTKVSKGILVSPTVHGNIFIGPNAVDVDQLDYAETTTSGLEEIISGARRMVPDLPMQGAITEFAGLRASAGHDFIIGESSAVKGLVHAAGIQSPGLDFAPAIAETIAECLREAGLELKPDPSFVPVNPRRPKFAEATRTEQAELVDADPLYGRVICRCETVTEGGNRRRDPGALRRSHDRRGEATGAARLRPLSGRVLRPARDRDLGPRTGNIPVTAVRKETEESCLYLPRERPGELAGERLEDGERIDA